MNAGQAATDAGPMREYKTIIMSAPGAKLKVRTGLTRESVSRGMYLVRMLTEYGAAHAVKAIRADLVLEMANT